MTPSGVAPRAFWTPARAMVASYLGVILLGALTLTLPIASRSEPIAFLDALFTATSAVCVTGLVVFDTAAQLTLFGQCTVMALIQLGGLGILTFTTWIILINRKPLGVFQQSSTGYSSVTGIPMRQVLTGVFVFTFVIEALGAWTLYRCWHETMSGPTALFQSLFHSISAFCNAGFSTLPNGLLPYRGDSVVNSAVSVLVIMGGLGFIVMVDVMRWVSRRVRRRLADWGVLAARPQAAHLTLHSRVSLQMTGLLLGGGMLVILFLEWSHSLAGLPLGEKLWASFFQSMSPRTAGFNTLDIGALFSSTLFIIVLMMIVGGSPGSTAGGIKTTTLAILIGLVRSQARGRQSVELKKRAVPDGDVARALATITLYMATMFAGVMLLLMTETWGGAVQTGHAQFLPILFETVSALSTVGLSMGITATLSAMGKFVVIVLMLCGRLGPIAVVAALVGEANRAPYQYVEESLLTG